MRVFRVRTGLTKGSIYLAVVLGVGTGVYIWRPMFDPAQKHKLGEYSKPDNPGNKRCRIRCLRIAVAYNIMVMLKDHTTRTNADQVN